MAPTPTFHPRSLAAARSELAVATRQAATAVSTLLGGAIIAVPDPAHVIPRPPDVMAPTDAQAVITMVWGTSGAPDPEWWRTPLGAACAASLVESASGAMSQTTAAVMLGLARTTVSTMLRRSVQEPRAYRDTLPRLEPGEDARVVTTASVLRRLVATHPIVDDVG